MVHELGLLYLIATVETHAQGSGTPANGPYASDHGALGLG